MYHFSTLQILQAIAYWPYKAFTHKELRFLLRYFLDEDLTLDDGVYEYGENDIHSFILEILSEMP